MERMQQPLTWQLAFSEETSRKYIILDAGGNQVGKEGFFCLLRLQAPALERMIIAGYSIYAKTQMKMSMNA